MATTLKVTFTNGKSICYRNSIDTVMAIVRGIEPERLDLIKLESKGRRLFTRNVAEEDTQYALEIGRGWYYIHKFQNTENKYRHLYQINHVLGLGIDIKIVDATEATDYHYREVRRNPMQQLKVILDDTRTIEGLSCAETLSQFVKHIGVETVARKDIIWRGNQLITTSQDNCRRIQVGDFRWILTPTNCKDTLNMIKFIASMTRSIVDVRVA